MNLKKGWCYRIMLGNYEQRQFSDGEKVWLGRYRNLANVLHWHMECEIIRILSGMAQVKIGDTCYDAPAGDCFFCGSEELHYIISQPDTQIDIMILDKSTTKGIADKYKLSSPKLPDSIPVSTYFENIKGELSQKKPFYREVLENHARNLIIDVFRNCPHNLRQDTSHFHKDLIHKINDEFSFISFEDAACYSGYSSSHFSKMFKQLTGMNFSQYLNIIRVENAVSMLQSTPADVASISLKCGFSTIRNFNRVFKSITGYAPRSLPKDFTFDTGLRISKSEPFDPTAKDSVLI